MLPPPALLFLIPLPGLVAAGLRLRASLVLAGGLVGAVAYMIVSMLWPRDMTEADAEAYYVVGHMAFVQSLVIAAAILAVAQAVKERLGREDRLTTTLLALMVQIGGALSLLPVTIPPQNRVAWLGHVGEIGAFVFMAGVAGLLLTLVVQPVLRRIKGRA